MNDGCRVPGGPALSQESRFRDDGYGHRNDFIACQLLAGNVLNDAAQGGRHPFENMSEIKSNEKNLIYGFIKSL